MKVSEVIKRGAELLGTEISVSGLIVNHNDDVFLVDDVPFADEESTHDRRGGIRVADEEAFGMKFVEVVPIRVGGYQYRKPASIVGVIGSSSVAPFPLEFSELREVVVRAEGEEHRLKL